VDERSSPADYRFSSARGVLPGVRGWLLIEFAGASLCGVGPGRQICPLTDWDTFSIDGPSSTSWNDRLTAMAAVQVSFDPRWHFPTYVYTPRLARPRHVGGLSRPRGLRPIYVRSSPDSNHNNERCGEQRVLRQLMPPSKRLKAGGR